MAYQFNELLERYRRYAVNYHVPRLLASKSRKTYLAKLKKQVLGFMLEAEQDPYKQTIITIINEGYHARTPLRKQFEVIQKERVAFLEQQLTEIENDEETEIGELVSEEGDKPVLHFVIRCYAAEFALQLIRELEKNPDQSKDDLKANVTVMMNYLLMK